MDSTLQSFGEQFSKHDMLASEIGIELVDISQGYAKAKLDITEKHLNSFRTVHGGTIFTLADFVFAVAANSHGTVAMAISVNISYLKAVTDGTLYAEAHEVSRNPKLGTYSVGVTDEDGNLVATFQGMAYRKKEPVPM
jgi:acyl-CoA thioesterase